MPAHKPSAPNRTQSKVPPLDVNTVVPFVKMQGIGNDYVYLDELELAERGVDPDLCGPWAAALSDRRFGVGGDGLILLRRSKNAACRMEMYNADGSRGAMCGNGIRCVASLAHRRGYSTSPTFEIETDSGTRAIEIVTTKGFSDQVRVNMGAAEIEDEWASVELGHPVPRTFEGTLLSFGNPHFVVPVDPELENFPVEEIGRQLERHPRFANSVNTEFCVQKDRTRVQMRVWERGSGETHACGTGATAVAFAYFTRGLVESTVIVGLLGGDLKIECGDPKNVYMTGAATEVFRGGFPLALTQG